MADAAVSTITSTAPEAILEISGLHTHYGESHVLHGVDLQVRHGEVVTLLGRNGAGKTTTLRSIMGIVRRRSGSIRLRGEELLGLAPHLVARRGIGYVPEERGIFASLSVDENLALPPVVADGGMSMTEIHDLFPNLRERGDTPGTRLSGGEQQMLAIARILRTGSDLVLLDEPTEGLAPVIIEQIGRVVQALKRRGFTVLLVEQNFSFAASIADRHYVMEEGRIVDVFDAADLATEMERIHRYLGV